MRKIISKIAGLVFGLSLATGVGVVCLNSKSSEVKANTTITWETVASSKSWSNGVAYTSFDYDGFHFEVSGGGNNGKYYTSDKTWRFYNGGGLTITSASGNTDVISSVSSNPSANFTVNSGTATASFSATVKFTTITINTSGGGGETPDPDPVTEHAGTLADPYTVADARAAIDASQGTSNVYATGVVSAIPTPYDSGYKNVTFNFTDEGKSDVLQAFRCKGNDAANVTIGDTVVVSGNLKKYNGTYEFDAGCTLVSLEHPQVEQTWNVTFNSNGGSESPTVHTVGDNLPFNFPSAGTLANNIFKGWSSDGGTTFFQAGESSPVVTADINYTAYWSTKGAEADPYTVAEAKAAIDANCGIKNIYVSGKISQIDSYQSNTITYWISADGSTTNQFEVYKGKGLNGESFSAKTDIEVGASVTIFGSIKKYNNVYEFDSGNYQLSYTAPTPALSSIALSGDYQTTFEQNDTFSYSGLVVTATYSNGSSKTVTPTSISNPDMTTTGQKTVTVTYIENEVEKTAEYTIQVNTPTVKHTVSFLPGYGEGTMASVQVSDGSSYDLPACTFTAPEGKVFAGWSLNGTDIVTSLESVTSDVSVTALWKDAPDETTVTTQVGTYASSNSWTTGTQYLTMVLDGYVTAAVDGGGNSGKYYENDSSWRLYSSENATLTISVSGDKTLSSVTLTFTTADSPTVEFNSASITSGTAVEASGTSAVFSVTAGKAHITAISVTYVGSGSSAESHTITYNSNGGTGGSMTPTVGSNPQVAECGYTKEGYTFARWNTQADGEGDNYEVGASVSEDLTLYAIWQEYVAPIEGNVSMEGVTSASAVTVNGRPGLKCGAGSTAGAMKLVLSSATISKIKVYVAGWKGDSSKTINIEATGCTIAETSISISEDSAVTGSSTEFTLSGSETTYKFIFEVSNATAGAEIALTAAQASKNRFVVWGATDLFAESFANEFNSNLTCDATGEDGPSFTSGHDWTTFNSFYNGLDAEEQGKLHDATFNVTGSGSSTVVTATGETAQSVAEAIAKYDYIIAKYGESNYTNFINRSIVPLASAPYVQPITASNSSTIVIVVVALTSISSIGVLLVIKRKRSLVK